MPDYDLHAYVRTQCFAQKWWFEIFPHNIICITCENKFYDCKDFQKPFILLLITPTFSQFPGRNIKQKF